MIVEVNLTNRWAYIQASEQAQTKLRDFWSFNPPGYRFSPAYRMGTWDGKIRLFKRGRVPSGLFRATKTEIQETFGLDFQLVYDLPTMPQLNVGFEMKDVRYDYQNHCVKAMLKALRRGGGIILSATRSGKTATAASFLSKLPFSCLFVVDQIDLLDQSQKELASWLKEDVGYVGDSQYQPSRVTVATRQTLSAHLEDPKFLDWYKQVKVIIVDELHEQMNKSNFSILEKIKPIARYGLTATLQLSRKEVRFKAYSFAGPVIFQFPIEEGIKKGILTQGRVLQLLFDPAPFTSEDYQEEYADQVTNHEVKKKAIYALTSTLLEHGKYVVILADRVKHVESISDTLALTPHRLAYGKIDKLSRASSRAKFEKGKIKLIISSKVFKKGITIKRLDAAIDCAEMKNKNDAVQKFGRGIGLHPDKEEFIYIDIGTSGKNRFRKAARSRARALREQKITVKTVEVQSVQHAVKTLENFLENSNAKEAIA